eukprot:8588341-Pyramimonas_sp.AAC.1
MHQYHASLCYSKIRQIPRQGPLLFKKNVQTRNKVLANPSAQGSPSQHSFKLPLKPPPPGGCLPPHIHRRKLGTSPRKSHTWTVGANRSVKT